MKNSSLTQAFSRLAIFLMVFGIAGSTAQLYAQRITGLLTSAVSVAEQDPNKPASELNHHLAGYALIAIGALVIAGYSSEKLRPLQLVWPFLFVAAGLFLAAWSDAEIWPRGNLSWRFLIHHDPEARLHKIYALLLILIGIIEYLRARGKLNRFWRSMGLSPPGSCRCCSVALPRPWADVRRFLPRGSSIHGFRVGRTGRRCPRLNAWHASPCVRVRFPTGRRSSRDIDLRGARKQ